MYIRDLLGVNLAAILGESGVVVDGHFDEDGGLGQRDHKSLRRKVVASPI